MIPLLELSASDRILFFAPHPDDESLGGAGLFQHAVQAGSKVHVVFVTNGDRNPWPQRVMERRWSIGPVENARWGARRKKEACTAVRRLGLPEGACVFFNWPDQGVTPLLLGAAESAVMAICEQILQFRPTLVVLPSPDDTHPDHSSFYVLARLAFARLGEQEIDCPHLTYVVHAPSYTIAAGKTAVALTGGEVEMKRRAIESHKTQMLSRRRFLAHARPLERFYVPHAPRTESAAHPIRRAAMEGGALRLQIELPKLARLGKPALHFAIESFMDGPVRWTLPLPASSQRVRIYDSHSREAGRYATVRIVGRTAVVAIPSWSVEPVKSVFVKLDCRPLFFDVAGWREVPVRDESTLSPALPLEGIVRVSASTT